MAQVRVTDAGDINVIPTAFTMRQTDVDTLAIYQKRVVDFTAKVADTKAKFRNVLAPILARAGYQLPAGEDALSFTVAADGIVTITTGPAS